MLSDSNTRLTDRLGERTFADILLTPTRIYVKPVLELLQQCQVKAIAHITGGGLPENIPRVLPDNVKADLDTGSWRWPAEFTWLQDTGDIDTAEMYRTFNCGVGMVLIVAPYDADRSIEVLSEQGEKAWPIGRISERTGSEARVILG